MSSSVCSGTPDAQATFSPPPLQQAPVQLQQPQHVYSQPVMAPTAQQPRQDDARARDNANQAQQLLAAATQKLQEALSVLKTGSHMSGELNGGVDANKILWITIVLFDFVTL